MNIKQIALISFIFIVLVVQLVSGQTPDTEAESNEAPSEEQVVENDESEEQVVENDEQEASDTPTSTENESTLEVEDQNAEPVTSEEILDDIDNEETTPITEEEGEDDNDNEETTPITEEEGEDEEPVNEIDTTPYKWEGTTRIFKLVNDYYVEPDEVVKTVIMISGDATIHGTVTGNVLVIGGDIVLSKDAQVEGLLQVVGGTITGDYEPTEKHIVSNGWRILPATAHLLMNPHTVWDIRKHRNFRFTTLKFGLLLLTYLLMALTFRKPIYAVSSILVERPISSILFSLLMFIVIPVAIWVIILSIVGFPLLILCLCLLVPLAICGKTAIFYTLGSTLLSGRLKPLAVIFGFVPYFMATEIPHVDWVTFLLFNVVGVGLCILSIIMAVSTQSFNKNVHWSERVRNNAS